MSSHDDDNLDFDFFDDDATREAPASSRVDAPPRASGGGGGAVRSFVGTTVEYYDFYLYATAAALGAIAALRAGDTVNEALVLFKEGHHGIQFQFGAGDLPPVELDRDQARPGGQVAQVRADSGSQLDHRWGQVGEHRGLVGVQVPVEVAAHGPEEGGVEPTAGRVRDERRTLRQVSGGVGGRDARCGGWLR